ncbi:MAG: mechanosensitive ion channel family protein [Lachnospiraceae bacterium]|nr:mechanosensitive ion channel family protein [Lachnospiraceae bacterium]
MQQAFSDNLGMAFVTIVITFIISVAVFLLYFLLAWLSLKLSKKIFRSFEKKQGKKIHLQFAEYIVKILIIVLFIVLPLAGDRIRQSILGSAAVITAVIGFAAQDVIKDILSGFLISIYKPFDLGDRIELEDGTAGIVESITMHHVVLTLVAVIISAIKDSPYSVPGKKNKKGEKDYGPVYFISIEDSALMMKTTVYYEPESPTEVVKDDIYTRVFDALKTSGIEVPYPHAQVILKDH